MPNFFFEEITFLCTQQESHSDAEDLCLFSNHTPFPRKRSQLFEFPTLWFQTTESIIPALEQPGDNMLTWTTAKIFLHTLQLTQGWGLGGCHLINEFYLFLLPSNAQVIPKPQTVASFPFTLYSEYDVLWYATSLWPVWVSCHTYWQGNMRSWGVLDQCLDTTKTLVCCQHDYLPESRLQHCINYWEENHSISSETRTHSYETS